MIKLSNFADIQKYFNVPDEAIAFLKSLTADSANGKYPFTDDCFVNVMNCDTKTEMASMEAHDNFVDVQCVIEGEEKILYTDRAGLTVVTPYNPDKDVLFYSFEQADEVIYRAGEAVVLYPADAHLPGRAANEPITIKKAVMKVRYTPA